MKHTGFFQRLWHSEGADLCCWNHNTVWGVFCDSDVDLIHRIRALLNPLPYVSVQYVPLSVSVMPLPRLTHKLLRSRTQSSGFDFTCSTVTDVADTHPPSLLPSLCPSGSSCMVICFPWHFHSLLSAGRLSWHHFALGCHWSVNWIRLVRFQGKWSWALLCESCPRRRLQKWKPRRYRKAAISHSGRGLLHG